MESFVRLRKIGGSVVATIPKEIAYKLHLKENEVIEIDVRRPKKSFFGALKNLPSFKESDRFDSK